MKLITIYSQIQTVAKRWNAIYTPEYANLKQLQIGHTLDIMDMRTATKDSIASIIGNNEWVGNNKCCACEEIYETIVEIDEGVFPVIGATQICHTCILKALEISRGRK